MSPSERETILQRLVLIDPTTRRSLTSHTMSALTGTFRRTYSYLVSHRVVPGRADYARERPHLISSLVVVSLPARVPEQQRQAHEQPAIFYSIALGFVGKSLLSVVSPMRPHHLLALSPCLAR